MAKHLNPLEKEFLIRKFKGNSKVKLSDFCRANNVSETSFKKWPDQRIVERRKMGPGESILAAFGDLRKRFL